MTPIRKQVSTLHSPAGSFFNPNIVLRRLGKKPIQQQTISSEVQTTTNRLQYIIIITTETRTIHLFSEDAMAAASAAPVSTIQQVLTITVGSIEVFPNVLHGGQTTKKSDAILCPISDFLSFDF